MENKGTKILESGRLILRPFVIEDAEAMYKNWASDPEVTKFLTWKPHENVNTTIESISRWINGYKDASFYQWAITVKTEGTEPIGSISVVNEIDEIIEDAEIGYCIGRKWWHRGITTEALECVEAFLFDEVGVKRISARHDANNPHSGDVMKKCGMAYEGRLRQAGKNNQGVCDECVYGLLKSEWQKDTKNAEYLTKLDRSFRQLDSGYGQAHELTEES